MTVAQMAKADHPRSRGVYSVYSGAQWFSRGSSPLARGLPVAAGVCEAGGWIIPARAGFTVGARVGFRYRGDHPRSRGVYAADDGRSDGEGGSSPLARGLLRVFRCAVVFAGIIPARAGFTGCRGGMRGGRLDHPRSRGVYRGRTSRISIPRGSSPLARGLRLIHRAVRGGQRIIPARAGFTSDEAAKKLADHGSSPLARGLPGRLMSRRRGRGIIPARAGFTCAIISVGRTIMDHPRSRGVYPRISSTISRARGSSPLARGLPVTGGDGFEWGGIIPARAGFTDRGSQGPEL